MPDPQIKAWLDGDMLTINKDFLSKEGKVHFITPPAKGSILVVTNSQTQQALQHPCDGIQWSFDDQF